MSIVVLTPAAIIIVILTPPTPHHCHFFPHAASTAVTPFATFATAMTPPTVVPASMVMVFANRPGQRAKGNDRQAQGHDPHKNQFDLAAAVAHPLTGLFVFVLFVHFFYKLSPWGQSAILQRVNPLIHAVKKLKSESL